MNETQPFKITFKGRELNFTLRDKTGVFKDNISDRLVLKETFELNTYSLSEQDFNHSGVFVDIGANIGAVSILASILGAKRVVAFEPEPENCKFLMEHLNGNSVPAEVHRVAVAGKNGNIKFLPSQGASTSREDALTAHPEMVIEVPAITLEEALTNIPEIDVLKCDCEGMEYGLFLNPAVNIKARKIVMEYHRTTREQFGAMVATLIRTHNVQAFGDWETGGGQLVAIRYGN